VLCIEIYEQTNHHKVFSLPFHVVFHTCLWYFLKSEVFLFSILSMNRNKLFFQKLGVFIILVLAINTLLNEAYNHWMYYFRLARTQDEQFNAYTGPLTYLMLGNSHNRVSPAVL